MSDLEARLSELGDHLDVPVGEGLAIAVVARIVPGDRPTRLRRWWRWLAGGAVVIAVGAGLSPAVGDLLGVGGVSVRMDSVPTSSTLAPSAPPLTMPPLDLGRRIALDDVGELAGFAPLLPTVLGSPAEVSIDERGKVPIVWLRWKEGPLLTELAGGMPDMPVIQKFAGGAAIRWVRAGSRPALWIEGVHEIVVSEIDGEMVVQRLRTADSTLLLEIDGVTIRIETTRGLDEALRIAESLRGT